MIRVLVLGASGMLGHKLCQVLSEQFDVWGTVREPTPAFIRLAAVPDTHVISGVSAQDANGLVQLLDAVRPDVVINAIGIVKQLKAASDPASSIIVNSLFPHRLAEFCQRVNARLIHVSTDCVFSGSRGLYSEKDLPDPVDLYGRTKLLGEVSGPNVLTVRTSIIGRELSGNHGLVEWFLSNQGKAVKGYSRAVFSGLPTLVLARVFGHVISAYPALTGLYHVAASPINKYRLLRLLRDAYDLTVEIEPFEDFVVDRSLDGSRFCDATGFAVEPWEILVDQMAADSTNYDHLRAG